MSMMRSYISVLLLNKNEDTPIPNVYSLILKQHQFYLTHLPYFPVLVANMSKTSRFSLRKTLKDRDFCFGKRTRVSLTFPYHIL